MGTSAVHRPAWSGHETWRALGVLVLAAIGVLHTVGGITAVVRTEGLDLASTPVLADYRAYGWGFVVTGAVLLAAAVGAWFGQLWARIAGGVLLALSFLNNLALPGGVLLSIVLMVAALLGIYAIVVHAKPVHRTPTG
ncbi:hypothetical protein GCM10027174_15180 [Salinifilum aidingensis]